MKKEHGKNNRSKVFQTIYLINKKVELTQKSEALTNVLESRIKGWGVKILVENENKDEIKVSSDEMFRQEVRGLSHEFTETMDDCQSLIKRYNQLLKVTQHLLKEIDQLNEIQNEFLVEGYSEDRSRQYYQRIGKGIMICSVLGEVVEKKSSLNDMIGHYLLGAKQEAATIISNAKKQTIQTADRISVLEKALSGREVELECVENELAHLRETSVTLNSYEDDQAMELKKLDIDKYSKQVKQEADRYSRQRKLLVDDQVKLAKREISEYAEKREQQLEKEEDRLRLLTIDLQEKFDLKVDGVLDSIAEYVNI